jgi:para-aminobenzoate synthetase component 1
VLNGPLPARPASADNSDVSTHSGGSSGTAASGLASLVLERLPALDGVAPADAAEGFRDLPGFGLLESARPGRAGRWSILVADPLEVLVGSSAGPDPFAGVRRALARLDGTHLPAGAAPFAGGVVGHLGYDLGRRLEAIPGRAIDDQELPDLRLGLHAWAVAWDRRDGRAWVTGRAVDADTVGLARTIAEVRERAAAVGRAPAGSEAGLPPLPPLVFASGTDRTGWDAGVAAVRAAIAAGELYQANLARRLAAPFDGDPWVIFRRLRAGEPAAFAAYLDLGRERGRGADGGLGDRDVGGRRAIVSASPEPFVSLDAARRIRTDPIKGTRPRGRTRAEDSGLAAELLASAKDRAENTMIVDVLRNDLGRVCRPGSVRAPRLWRLERTPSVQHLVSTITGGLAPGRDAFDLLSATFPGGSVTGAPKIRAMELIEALEPVRRGPYCGAALWVDAAGAMGSSILIRTFVADGRRLTLHVGGGITWRSDAAAEWEETRAKARGPLRAIGGRVAGEEEP